MTKARPIAFGVLAVVLCMAAGYVGFRAGHAYTLQSLVGSGDSDRWAPYALRYALGLEEAHASYGQDLWVAYEVFPDVDDGYFVDLGSADGTLISNTKALEARGWRGICIDAFPRNMEGRTCTVFREAVDAAAGRQVRFQSPGSYSGGIVAYAGWWVSDEDKAHSVELTTATLADILHRAEAPKFIHYMNVDIEGAEYEALTGFPFDEYKVGAITVEHNNVPERRARIRDLLEAHGYRLEWALRDQDWYLGSDIPRADSDEIARPAR